MYDNILVPVALDHGERAANSIAVARKLAWATTRIVLLTVLDAIPSYIALELPEGTLEGKQADARADLVAIATAAGLDPEQVEVVWGNPSRQILERAEAEGCDLIVIASHKPGFEDIFLGSTAARVVRHAQCCVHVIR